MTAVVLVAVALLAIVVGALWRSVRRLQGKHSAQPATGVERRLLDLEAKERRRAQQEAEKRR